MRHCEEQRAGNTRLSTWEGEIQESESLKSRSGERCLIWCQSTNGGLIQVTNPWKIAKPKSFLKVYLEKNHNAGESLLHSVVILFLLSNMHHTVRMQLLLFQR